MASSILKTLTKTPTSITYNYLSSTFPHLKTLNFSHSQNQNFGNAAAYDDEKARIKNREEEFEKFPTEGISKPMSEVLKQLNKKVPDSVISVRAEDGVHIKYIPWHIVNRIMNLHAPEWSGEVRNIVYSADGKSVTVVYRVTLHGTDAEIHRESTGTAPVEDKGFGDAVQKAEGMAFRRACARLGLGLHLYHEDMS